MKFLTFTTIIFTTIFAANVNAEALFSINADRSIKLNAAAEQALLSKRVKVKLLTYSEFSEGVQSLFNDLAGVSPIAFSSDFNGDGNLDLAVIAGNNDKIYALALIAKEKVYEVLVLDQWPRNKEGGETTYVTRLTSDRVRVKKGSKRKAQDVIQVETYLGAVNAFFIKDFKAIPYRGEFW